MKIFSSIYDFQTQGKTVLTLGTFDGVHLGHQSILKKLEKASDELNCESLVLTFFPHPRMVLQQDGDIKLLNTIDEKAELLRKFGVDNLIVHPFDNRFSQLSAEEFVSEILVKQFNIAKIIIGYDHRFGKNRSATIDDLIVFGEKYGFEVEQISAKEIDEVSVSSTKIRVALDNGDITTANSYLGYKYSFSGKVVQGKQLGRTIGFPTANIQIAEDYKLIPKIGVYVVKATYQGRTIGGMMNIGFKPTVDGIAKTIEVHLFDFKEDLYGTDLKIEVLHRLRDEQKFSSVDHLKEQLFQDKKLSLEYFAK
ncbi:bifunctional riboflavin kinase/FAD synthetase [Flavobacterium sp.]|uniref:bifunctional riboflavin kinase/FAD synthetase n=1 Tax=Flavobacterium sp. TaxID=239 RepID=UPI0028BE8E1B|nr:bifunctional riboflavin kinase/FAD synthetase [Flavobacterium sp.]